MSHLDELHARLEAAIARGRDTEQRFTALMTRHAEQQREDAAEAEAIQRLIQGLLEVAQRVARMASVDAHGVPALRRCQICLVVGHEPLEHERECLAAQARALLAATPAPSTTAGEEVEA